LTQCNGRCLPIHAGTSNLKRTHLAVSDFNATPLLGWNPDIQRTEHLVIASGPSIREWLLLLSDAVPLVLMLAEQDDRTRPLICCSAGTGLELARLFESERLRAE